MLNEKTHAMLDEANRINHVQVEGGWGWRPSLFDPTDGSWERWLQVVNAIITGIDSDDAILPAVDESEARGRLLAELLYELTTHYPARARAMATEPTTEIHLHNSQCVEAWLVDIEKWLEVLLRLLGSPIWEQKVLALITEGTHKERESVHNAVARGVGANLPVEPELDLRALQKYVAAVDEVVETTKAQVASVRLYRKRLPSRWLVRVVGSLGVIAVFTGVLVPMLDTTASHHIDIWIPGAVYALAVLAVLIGCWRYSRDAGAKMADASVPQP